MKISPPIASGFVATTARTQQNSPLSFIEQIFAGAIVPRSIAERAHVRQLYEKAFYLNKKSPEKFAHYFAIDALLVPILRHDLPLKRAEADALLRWLSQNVHHKATNKKAKLPGTLRRQTEEARMMAAVCRRVNLKLTRLDEFNEKHAYAVIAVLSLRNVSEGRFCNVCETMAQIFLANAKRKNLRIHNGQAEAWIAFRTDFVAHFSFWPAFRKSTTAIYDHSLSILDISVDDVLNEIDEQHRWAKNIIRLAFEFGLRIGEATRTDIEQSWRGNLLKITLEAQPKGLRLRDVRVTFPKSQLPCINQIRQFLANQNWGGRLYPPTKTAQQAVASVGYHFRQAVKKIKAKRDVELFARMPSARKSIRFHDMRHDYIHRLARLIGADIPVANVQAKLTGVSLEKVYLYLMLQVGHSDPTKTHAYIGRLPKQKQIKYAKYATRDMKIFGHGSLHNFFFNRNMELK